MYCYCPASIAEFHKWLQKKYGSVEAVAQAWRRYSFASWDDVQPSRTGGPYPDWLDWLQFREDRAHELLHWRKEIIRSVDQKNKITMGAPGSACDSNNPQFGKLSSGRATGRQIQFGLKLYF